MGGPKQPRPALPFEARGANILIDSMDCTGCSHWWHSRVLLKTLPKSSNICNSRASSVVVFFLLRPSSNSPKVGSNKLEEQPRTHTLQLAGLLWWEKDYILVISMLQCNRYVSTHLLINCSRTNFQASVWVRKGMARILEKRWIEMKGSFAHWLPGSKLLSHSANDYAYI